MCPMQDTALYISFTGCPGNLLPYLSVFQQFFLGRAMLQKSGVYLCKSCTGCRRQFFDKREKTFQGPFFVHTILCFPKFRSGYMKGRKKSQGTHIIFFLQSQYFTWSFFLFPLLRVNNIYFQYNFWEFHGYLCRMNREKYTYSICLELEVYICI